MLRRAHRSGGLARADGAHVRRRRDRWLRRTLPTAREASVRRMRARTHASSRWSAERGCQRRDQRRRPRPGSAALGTAHAPGRNRGAGAIPSRCHLCDLPPQPPRPPVPTPTAGAHDVAVLRSKVSLGAAEGSRGAIVEVSARFPNRSAAPVGLRTLSTLDGPPCPNPTITMGIAAPSLAGSNVSCLLPPRVPCSR
jgi:hypothetical protein